MSSTVTTVVSSAVTGGVYATVFQIFVVVALLATLALVEFTVGVRNLGVRRMSRSAALLTAPMLVAFVALILAKAAQVTAS